MSILIAYLIIGLVMTVGALLDDSCSGVFENVLFAALYPLLWLPLTASMWWNAHCDMGALASPCWPFLMAHRQHSDRELYGC